MIYCINKGKIKNLTIGKKYKVIKKQSDTPVQKNHIMGFG